MATRKKAAAKSAAKKSPKSAKSPAKSSGGGDEARQKRLAALKAQYSGDPAAAAPDAEQAGAGDRRQRLQSLKEQFAKDMPAGVGESAGGAPGGGPRTQAAELSGFLQSMGGRKQKRQHQLQLIKEFFDNPLAFGAEANIIPTSTTAAEIEQRKKEVNYRIDLIKSVLAVLEGEMEMLNRGRPALRGTQEPEADV
jgi:hypothetical protein